MRKNVWLYRSAWLSVALALAGTLQARQKQIAELRPAKAAGRPASTAHSSSRIVSTHAEYVIGPADVLAIDVWHEPEISRVEPVRPDGRITLPLAGEIEASGETTHSLQKEIAQRLAHYIRQPDVTVIVQQAKSYRFNIIGDVLRPGSYSLGARMSVLDTIAAAGGFGEFAKVTRIYVVRRRTDGSSLRIPFNYKDAVRGDRRDLDLVLMPGDTVIVP
ncbi:MAG TPA: polysaccharide biosynthesis/export family protein [Patescibacteria group bacterium]|nr:polysaccharide biosynthesis/export family protein [Patescibacteria group bacterium]